MFNICSAWTCWTHTVWTLSEQCQNVFQWVLWTHFWTCHSFRTYCCDYIEKKNEEKNKMHLFQPSQEHCKLCKLMMVSADEIKPLLNTLHAWFYWPKSCLLSDILTANSRFTEPIPGMLVLIWMHFSLWFQIWSWNSTISTSFYKFC